MVLSSTTSISTGLFSKNSKSCKKIQTVMNKYEQLEKRAEDMRHEREHQRYLGAMSEAQRQREHIHFSEQFTGQTEAQIRHRREELDQVERNLELCAEE